MKAAGAGGKAHTASTRRKRRSPELVVRELSEADRALAQGADTAEVARQLELKRLQADAGLEKDALQEIAEGCF